MPDTTPISQYHNEPIFANCSVHWINQNLAIFPCRGKIPLTPHGVKDATTDPGVIDRWSHEFPNANIGLATGKINGITVVDSDGIEGSLSWDSISDRDETTTVQTAKGWHYYYTYIEGIGNKVRVLPGIDIRNDGGYVIAPPSIHESGKRYEFYDGYNIRNMPLGRFPAALIPAALGDPTAPGANGDAITEGRRNNTLFRLACSMQARGLPDAAIWAACSGTNSTFAPPLTEGEVAKIIKSAFTKPKGRAPGMGGAQIDPREILQELKKNREKPKRNQYLEIVDWLSDKSIRYDTFTNRSVYDGRVVTDATYREIWEKISRDHNSGFTKDLIVEAITRVAETHPFDSLREAFDSIPSMPNDGLLDTWLSIWWGVEDTPYSRAVGKSWILGAVARVYEPGCVMRDVLVLQGKEGIGKSLGLQELCIDQSFFSDSLPGDLHDQHAPAALFGKHIIEAAEMAYLRRTALEVYKFFFAARVDTYLGKWQRTTQDFPRRCVFAATTNREDFLSAGEQHTRLLPVTAIHYDRERALQLKIDLWAQAKHAFLAGAPRIFNQKLASLVRDTFTEEDVWAEKVFEYISLSGKDAPISINKMWESQYGFNEKSSRLSKSDQMRIATILKSMGYEVKHMRKCNCWVKHW